MRKNQQNSLQNDHESEFVNAILNGSASAGKDLNHYVDEMYENCHKMTKSIAINYHLDEFQADDLLQETIESLLENINKGKFIYNSKNEFYGYLKSIMRNKALRLVEEGKCWIPLNSWSDKDEDFENMDNDEGKSSELDFFCIEEIEFEFADILESPQNDNQNSNCLNAALARLFNEKLTSTGAKVLKIAMIDGCTNAEGAELMGYANEAVFRKKKSGYLKELQAKLSNRERAILMGLAA